LIDVVNYRLVLKSVMASEIRHYLNVFKKKDNWHEVGTYDDFLIEAAFNENLSVNMRVLAAMNYGTIASMMSFIPRFEDRLYRVFCEIVPDYLTSKE
jgi:hypothetical protein